MRETHHRTVTKQGTEILIEPLANVRSCSVGFWVRRGSVHEEPGEEGLAHFIEHTVFKGTKRYPDPVSLSNACDMLGGSLDAFTGKENACFYGKVLAEQLPELVDILGELVSAPLFDSVEVEREREVILEEIAQSEDQAEDWVSELFYMNFWKDTSLAHPILGRPEQIARYGRDEAGAFFRKTYNAPNLLIAAAGDLKVEPFLKLLQPVLDRFPAGQAGNPLSPVKFSPFLINAPRKDLQQASLILGFPVGGHQDPDRVVLGLLSHILGGGASSRLFMELREKHSLCYQIGSFISHYHGGGALQISASCAQDKARELVQRAGGECRRLAAAGATQDELDRAKLLARTSLVFSQESTSAHMFGLAYQAINMERIRSLDEQMEEIAAVDLDSLNRVAREVLDPTNLSVAALGTKKGGEIRKEDLA